MSHSNDRPRAATRAPRHIGQTSLPARIYRFRMLGMGVGALPIAMVLHEHGWPSSWITAYLLFTGAVWPQLAWWLARRSAEPFRAETRNLLIDSFIAGLWAPLLHFNLLPSVLLLTVTTSDKIVTGVRGLWLRSLPGMLLGIAVGGVATGFAVQLPSSTAVIVACLPLLVVHTLAGSLAAHRLVRTVQKRNQQLAELSRQDALTGLANHRHWHEESARQLQARAAQGLPSTLLMADMDRLKAINDQHGHAAGDDALRTLATLLREHAGPSALAGRLGGDEFAALLPCALADAQAFAEGLRAAMAAQRWPQRPELRCTISLGLAEADRREGSLHDWSECADRALYRAKQAGRNRIAGPVQAVQE